MRKSAKSTIDLGADWHRYQQQGGGADDFDWSRWTGGAPGYGAQYGGTEDMFGGAGLCPTFSARCLAAWGMGGRPQGQWGGRQATSPASSRARY